MLRKIAAFEEKLKQKDEVIAEFTEELLALKKRIMAYGGES